MEREPDLERVTRAVLAAFPDRGEAMLDSIERAFHMSEPASPPGRECAMCGRGQAPRYPLVLLTEDPPVYYLRPSVVAPPPPGMAPPWRPDDAYPDAAVACLDCLRAARDEFSPTPPSATADRGLLDALRAVRASGFDDVERTARVLEAAFAGAGAPRIHPGMCTICRAPRACAQGPAGAGLCEDCAVRHWRAVATDALTGASTRAMFLSRLDAAIGRARRIGRPLSILLIDVDQFKSFNDIHGHLVGDALLTRAPGVFTSAAAGAIETVYRWGGEEFAMILPQRTVAEAVAIAEAIRARAMAALRPPDATRYPEEDRRVTASGRPHFPGGRVTVSIGVAGLHPDADAPALLRAADEQVHRAKSSGRNAVCG